MKLWAGRFSKEVDKKTNDFNSSISFDERMFEEDINGSIAHAKMLLKQNIIEKSDEEKIVSELEKIKVKFPRESFKLIPMRKIYILLSKVN